MRRRKRLLAAVGLLTAVSGWFLLEGLWGPGHPSDGSSFTSQAAEERPDLPAEQGAVSAFSADGGSRQILRPEAIVFAEEPAFVPAADGYFSDALFIGDSRTQGLELYGGIDEATYYTAQGLMVNTALVKTVVTLDGQQVSIPDALDRRPFGKIYIMLGTNELGWKSQERFIQYYGQLLDTIREKCPDAVIYVQSLPPVSREKSESDEVYNNTRVALYNGCIRQAAEGRDVVWLDVGAALQGADGCMPENSTFDGVHLNQEYCRKWADFLRANTVKK